MSPFIISDTVIKRKTPAITPSVIAITSGKGGCGKTWLSITLAHALSITGKNVLLFDADLGITNIDAQMGLTPKIDISSILCGTAPLTQAITHTDIHDLDVITGHSGTTCLAKLPTDRMYALIADLKTLSTHYDTVLIDLGNNSANHNLLLELTHTALVVCTNNQESMADAHTFIKEQSIQHPALEIRVVVNCATSIKEGENTFMTLRKSCESFTKSPLILGGIVRQDSCVREAVSAQTPLLSLFPESNAAHDITGILQK